MAQTALEKAENDEEKAKAQYWIGLSYYSQGKKTEAEKAELLAISLNPDYEPPYVTLSAIKLDLKDCSQAFTYAQKALQLKPNDCWNLNNLGLAYLCLFDKENAIIQLQKALSLAPNSDIIRNNLEIAIQKNY
jgi:Flp pilus assembly protein TadD